MVVLLMSTTTMKKKRVFINVLFLCVFAFMLLVFYSIYKARNPVVIWASDAEFISLGTKVSLIPNDSPPSIEYSKFKTDGRMSKNDFARIDKMFHEYLQQSVISKQAEIKKIEDMSPLEKAKDNLEAFDEFGYLVVPKEKIPEVRREMLSTIKRLEVAEKNRN